MVAFESLPAAYDIHIPSDKVKQFSQSYYSFSMVRILATVVTVSDFVSRFESLRQQLVIIRKKPQILPNTDTYGSEEPNCLKTSQSYIPCKVYKG